MKLFTTEKIREWDQFTVIQHYEHSTELMEVAAKAVVDHLMETEPSLTYTIVCGTGNNGGDGLCIGRLLFEQEYDVKIVVVGHADNGSEDFKHHLQRVLNMEIDISFFTDSHSHFTIRTEDTILDCMIGTGISRPVQDWRADLIEKINSLPNKVIAVDVPSGLLPDLLELQQGAIIRANYTITLQIPKRAFLFPENFQFVGEFVVVPIGLDSGFEAQQNSDFLYYEYGEAIADFRPRKKFAHKNLFGHVCLVAGAHGMMGAAILSARGSFRSGAGLVTAVVPAAETSIVQTAIPEAICMNREDFSSADHTQFSAIGIGPGLGLSSDAAALVYHFLTSSNQAMVLDADALNLIARNEWVKLIPPNTIITPHVGEFDRLFGIQANSFARFRMQCAKSAEHHLIIVLKGANTCITFPDGMVVFNSTGNPGMATAGSGDALSGIILALLGSGYKPAVAARFAVFMHGMAGDVAATLHGHTALMAGDIVESLPDAFLELESGIAY